MYQTLNNFLVKTSGLDLVAHNVVNKVDDQLENSVEEIVESINENVSKDDHKDVPKEHSVKTLMLLHGWGMNSQVWEPIREALEAQYHVIWVDLPGHGFNRSIEAKSLDNMVSLIAEVTPENTHLMGWSLGGLVAQALAQRVPEKIKSMTLVSSTPRFSQVLSGEGSVEVNHENHHENNPDWHHAMSEEVLNRFANNLIQDTEKTLKGFIALQFIGVKDAKQAQTKLINHILNTEETHEKWGGVSLNADNQPLKDATNIPSQEALDVGLTILKHADLRNVAPECPQHWIFSEYDRLIPKDVINDLISLRPDAEITLLEKAGHAPFITHTDDFLKHATRFIDAL